MLNARLRRSGPWLPSIVAGAIGVIVGAALLVGARTQVTSLRYELAELLAREARLIEDTEKLRLESAALRATDRLLPAARALGMAWPEPGQIVALESPQSTDVAAGRAPR